MPQPGLAMADVGEEVSAAEFMSAHSGATTHSTTKPEHVTFKVGCSQVHCK